MPEFTSSRVEEFYNHVHDGAGGPAKSEKIGKVPASSHIDYDRVIKNLNAHTQGAVNFFRDT